MSQIIKYFPTDKIFFKRIAENFKKTFAIVIILMASSFSLYCQVFFNSGVQVILKNNAIIQVNGYAANDQGKITTEGNFNVTRNLTNNDTLTGNGKYLVGGDWINNDLYTTSSGTVELNGSNQLITGTSVTTFFNLTLTGSGIKTMTLNAYTGGTLTLNDRELASDTNIMFVTNTNVNSITRTSGFVSSLGNGKLSRATNSTGTYLFPVGSSVGTTRYRPVDIIPNYAATDSFRVRMCNTDATADGFDRSLTDTSVCLINPDFYHRITHTTANSADIRIFFDNAADGSYTNITHWQNVPQWENTGAVTITSNVSPALSYITKTSWGNFTFEPIALAGAGLLSTITKTDISCGSTNDGTATVSVSGGQTPFIYIWSNGQTAVTATGLIAGSYYVTSTDANNCNAVDSITITGSTPIVLTLGSTADNCSAGNGSVTVNVSGGLTPYSYSWSNGDSTSSALGLFAGSYTVTVTDFAGCDTSSSVTVAGTTGPSVSTSFAQPACFGENTGSATAAASGGTSPYSYLWNNSQNTSTASALAAGTYYVTVSDSVGCQKTDTVIITQPSQLLTNKTSSNASCNGAADGNATITASGGTVPYSFAWSNGQISATATGLVAGTYFVTSSDSNSCNVIDTVTILGSTPIILSLGSTNDNCGDSVGSASVNVSGGIIPYTYLWSNGQTSQGISGLAAGNYSVTVTDSLGCDTTATVLVNSTGGAALSMASTTLACYGDNNGTATVIASGGTSPYTYLWNDPLAQADSTATGLVAGAYTVTVTDSNNCPSIDTISVSQPAALLAVFSTTPASCNGAPDGTAIVTASGGISPYSFTWSNSQNDSAATGLASGIYYVTITDSNNCPEVDSVTITEGSLTLTLTSVSATCSSPNGSATATVSGGTGPYDFLWVDGQTTSTATGLSAGNYSVTVSDSAGCDTSSTVTVNGSGGANLLTSATNLSCNGDNSGTATVIPSGGTAPYSYNWNDSLNQTSPTATGLPAGSYNVTVTDNNNCPSIDSITISEPPALVTLTSGSNVSCNGLSDGTANVSVSGGFSPYTYSWSNSQTDSSLTGLVAGVYQVTLSDSNSCSTVDSITVSEPPAISLTVSGNTSFCEGAGTSLTASATGAASFFWSTGDSSATISVNPPSDTSYTVIATANSCTDIEQVQVNVNQLPSVTINGDSTICAGSSTLLTATGGSTYIWNTLDTTSSLSVNPNSSTVYYVSTSNSCGTDSSFYSVVVFPLPSADAGNDTAIVEQTTITLNASGGISYLWNTSSDLSCTGCQKPVASPGDDATYYVTVTDANGCISVDSVKISVMDGEGIWYFPNVFSPNGDGENDVLYVMGQFIDVVALTIYDRWGEKVFESSCCCTKDCGWDGTFRGKPMNSGAFVYLLDGTLKDGTPFSKKGNLMLIR